MPETPAAASLWELRLVGGASTVRSVPLSQDVTIGRTALGIDGSTISRSRHVRFFCDAEHTVRCVALHENPVRIVASGGEASHEIGLGHANGDSALLYPGCLLQLGDLENSVDRKVFGYLLARGSPPQKLSGAMAGSATARVDVAVQASEPAPANAASQAVPPRTITADAGVQAVEPAPTQADASMQVVPAAADASMQVAPAAADSSVSVVVASSCSRRHHEH